MNAKREHSDEKGTWVAVFADGTERVIEQAVTPEEFVTGTCPTCGGWGTYRGCSACNDTGCSLYTAQGRQQFSTSTQLTQRSSSGRSRRGGALGHRRWSPGADRCSGCGQRRVLTVTNVPERSAE